VRRLALPLRIARPKCLARSRLAAPQTQPHIEPEPTLDNGTWTFVILCHLLCGSPFYQKRKLKVVSLGGDSMNIAGGVHRSPFTVHRCRKSLYPQRCVLHPPCDHSKRYSRSRRDSEGRARTPFAGEDKLLQCFARTPGPVSNAQSLRQIGRIAGIAYSNPGQCFIPFRN
jgi:hypothetical protein